MRVWRRPPPCPAGMRESALERTERFLQEKFHVVRRADAVLAWFRSFPPPIMFLAIATVLGLTAVVSTVYVPPIRWCWTGSPSAWWPARLTLTRR